MDITAGTVTLAGAGKLTSGSLLLENAATILDLGASEQTTGIFRLAGGILQNGSLNASAFNVESGLVTAVLQGTGTFTKSTTGTVTLSGANSLSGAMDITAGTVTLAGAGKLTSGSLLLENAATILDLGATSQTSGVFRLAGGTLQNGSLSAAAFNLESGLITAVLQGTGTFTKSTTGTVTLTGANTFSGPIHLNAGTLLFAGTSTSSGSITIASGATLMGAATLPASATLASGGFLSPGAAASTGKLTLAGLTLTGGATLNFKLNTPLTSDQLVISTSNAFSLTGSNTITLSLAPGVTSPAAIGTYKLLSYTGTTRTTGLSLASPVFATRDARLVWNANDVSLQLSATAAPVVSISANVPSGSVLQAGTSISFAASVTGTPNFTYQWRKNGANISGGSLDTFQIPVAAIVDSGSYDIVVNSAFGTATSNTFALSIADFFQPLTLLVPDTNAVTYAGTQGFLGGVSLVRNGTGAINFPASVAIPGSLSYSGSTTTPLSVSTSISSITKTITQSSDTSVFTLSGTLAMNASGTTLANKGAALFTMAAATTGAGTLTTNAASSGSIALSGAINPTGAFTNSGLGSGSVTVSGSLGVAITSVNQNSATSPLLLTSANPFTAPVTVNAGSLVVTANNALGTAAAGTTLKPGATLDLRNVAYSTAEALDVQGGTLLLSTGISSFAGPITLTSAAASIPVNGTSLTLSGAISGAAGFVKTGPGALYLNGTNSGSGPITLSTGTLAVTSAAALGTGALTLGNGTTLALNTAGDSTLSAPISGTGSITKSGAGTVTLASTSTGSSPITVTAGTLKIATGVSIGTGSISVSPGAVLAFNLTADKTISNVITGTVTSTNPAYRITWNGGAVGGPVPVVTSPATTTITLGSSLSYLLAASNGPVTMSTLSTTVLPSGVNFNASTGLLSGKPATAGTFILSFKLSNPGGSITFPLTLTVNYAPSAPAITTQPASITIPSGTTGVLSATILSRTTMVYQWKKNGVLIGTAVTVPGSNTPTTVTLALGNASLGTEGLFSVAASNPQGGPIESAPAIVRVDLGIPKLSNARLVRKGTIYDLSKATTNSLVDLGSNIYTNEVFQITPSSDPTTTYTWSWAPLTPGSFKTIASQATARLDFSAADVPKLPGYFNFLIKNKNGSITLRFRILSFKGLGPDPAKPTPMAIWTQPFPVTIGAGGAANFGVVVTGSPVSFSWYKETGAVDAKMNTSPSPFFTLSPVAAANAGDYYVVATDAYSREVVSTQVHLSVIPLGE